MVASQPACVLETSISVDLNIHDVAVARIDNKLDRATMVYDTCGKLWQEVNNGMSKLLLVCKILVFEIIIMGASPLLHLCQHHYYHWFDYHQRTTKVLEHSDALPLHHLAHL